MRAGGAGVGQAGYAVATGGFIPMVGTEDELGSEHKFAEPMARPSGAAQQYCDLTPIRPLRWYPLRVLPPHRLLRECRMPFF